MSRQVFTLMIVFFSFLLTSCGVMHEGYESVLRNGNYQQGSVEKYVQVEDQYIALYPTSNDSILKGLKYDLPFLSDTAIPKLKLTKNSFDLDLIYIPFKFRFARASVPIQLNTNINTAVYTGFRKDFHFLKYNIKKLGGYELDISNFGISIGLFNGISNADINETSTKGQLDIEYNGVVWMYGLNVVAGWNKITFGLAVGKDLLLDKNRNKWIYNQQPWLGLTLGLNLN